MKQLYEPLQFLDRHNQNLSMTMFICMSLSYILMDNDTTLFKYIQLTFGLLSVCLLIINKFRVQSMGYAFEAFLTLMLLIVERGSVYYKLHILSPIGFLLNCQSIRTKFITIGRVMSQELWLMISLTVCFQVLGGLAYLLFKQNEEYYGTPQRASLTFMQIATFDSFKQPVHTMIDLRGGFIALFMLLLVLFFAHGLLNINMAFILAFISDQYKSQRMMLDINRNLFGDDVPTNVMIFRLANIIASVWVLFQPYNEAMMDLYLASSICSCFLLLVIQYLKGELSLWGSLGNISLEIVVIITFFSGSHYLMFVFMLIRITLILEIRMLYEKVWKALRRIQNKLFFSLWCFVLYTFTFYVMKTTESEDANGIIVKTIVTALRTACLDDFVVLMREEGLLMDCLTILYIILLNFILMNMLVSEMFNQIEMEDIQHKIKSAAGSRRESQQNSEQQEKYEEEKLPDAVKTFIKTAKQLNYGPKRD